MTDVLHRPVREEEIPEAASLFITSVNDLAAFTHLLFTAEPGQMDRYVPSGPSLF